MLWPAVFTKACVGSEMMVREMFLIGMTMSPATSEEQNTYYNIGHQLPVHQRSRTLNAGTSNLKELQMKTTATTRRRRRRSRRRTTTTTTATHKKQQLFLTTGVHPYATELPGMFIQTLHDLLLLNKLK